MQYLGGKSRIAKDVATIINEVRGVRPFWEPFCGALNVTAELGSDGLASDRHAGLIALYNACANPRLLDELETLHVTPELYAEARTWGESDPIATFLGFGASFGGKWFAGLARSADNKNYPAMAARSLRRKLKNPPAFAQLDFMQVQPTAIDHVLYCDPPYRGTTGYKFDFDSAAFEARALAWAQYTDVFVSEYRFPFGVCCWQARAENRTLAGGVNGKQASTEKLERLFFIPKGSI